MFLELKKKKSSTIVPEKISLNPLFRETFPRETRTLFRVVKPLRLYKEYGEKKERTSVEITESSNEKERERKREEKSCEHSVEKPWPWTIPRPRYYFLGFLYDIFYTVKKGILPGWRDKIEKKRYVHERVEQRGEREITRDKGERSETTENSGGMKRMLNIGRLKQSQKKKKNRMKETKGGNLEKEGNLWHMKEGGEKEGAWGCYIRRTVFVF